MSHLATLTSQQDRTGYLLYYRGHCIGGAGRLYPGQDLSELFSGLAKRDIRAIQEGEGEARYLQAMERVDALIEAGRLAQLIVENAQNEEVCHPG